MKKLILFFSLLASPFVYAQMSIEERFEKAANGDAYAQFLVGDSYYRGDGVDVDYDQALFWLEQSASQKFAPALFRLGEVFENGNAVKVDSVKAFNYYEQAAKLDFLPAQEHLGYCYRVGLGVKENHTTAVSWYKKAVSNPKKGNDSYRGTAAANLADMYTIGEGVDVDFQEAKSWYEIAQKYGTPFSEEKYKEVIDYLAFHGNDTIDQRIEQAWHDVQSKDYSIKMPAFRKIINYADKGYGKALGYAGMCYQHFIVVPKDINKAFAFFEAGAKKNDPLSLRELGAFYLEGDIVKKDLNKGIKYVTKAAELGDKGSYYLLGLAYGEMGNKKKSLEWHEKAAYEHYEYSYWALIQDALDNRQINTASLLVLMAVTDLEDGTMIDAFGENGARFEFLLGSFYEYGIGIIKEDKEKAVEWYTKAADHGDKYAINALQEILNK